MKYPQSFMKAVGEYGCYALCIINIAEQIKGSKYDVLGVLEEGIRQTYKDDKGVEHGYIEFHEENYNHPDNFYVNRPDLFLGMLVGGNWSVRKESDILYKPQPGEYVVERWERNGFGHFARTKEGFNSLQDSKCVTLGKLASLRVFKRI